MFILWSRLWLWGHIQQSWFPFLLLHKSNQYKLFIGTLLSITAERDILRKEYKSKTYGIPAIYFSRYVYELMIMLPLSLSLKTVNYFGANLEDSFENFSVFFIVFVLIVIFSQTYGMLVGTLFYDEKATVHFSAVLFGPLVVFGGYIVHIENVYVWMRWMQYLSPIRFAFEILLKNEFDDNSKYKTNANDRYELDFGIFNWYIMLTVSIFVTALLGFLTLTRVISAK